MKRRQAVIFILAILSVTPVLTAYSQPRLLETEHGLRPRRRLRHADTPWWRHPPQCDADHDRAYDLHGASGPQGVMGNFDVVDADYDLYLRAKSISETAPKGTELLKWATRTAKLFKQVSSFKYSIKSLF